MHVYSPFFVVIFKVKVFFIELYCACSTNVNIIQTIKDYEFRFACNNTPRVFSKTLALWKQTAQLLKVRNVSGRNNGSQNGQHMFWFNTGKPKRACRMLKRLVCLQHDNYSQIDSQMMMSLKLWTRGRTALHLFLKKTLSCDL